MHASLPDLDALRPVPERVARLTLLRLGGHHTQFSVPILDWRTGLLTRCVPSQGPLLRLLHRRFAYLLTEHLAARDESIALEQVEAFTRRKQLRRTIRNEKAHPRRYTSVLVR